MISGKKMTKDHTSLLKKESIRENEAKVFKNIPSLAN